MIIRILIIKSRKGTLDRRDISGVGGDDSDEINAS
jgi:hypothetical protein